MTKKKLGLDLPQDYTAAPGVAIAGGATGQHKMSQVQVEVVW